MLIGLISLAISAVGAIGSAVAGKKARKANRAAAANEKEIRSVRNVQAKRDFIKKFRLAQGEALAQGGAVEGGLDSSRTQGNVSANVTQAKVGLAEQNKLAELDASAVDNANRAAGFSNTAQAFRTGANLVTSALALVPAAPTTTPVITEQPLGGIDG